MLVNCIHFLEGHILLFNVSIVSQLYQQLFPSIFFNNILFFQKPNDRTDADFKDIWNQLQLPKPSPVPQSTSPSSSSNSATPSQPPDDRLPPGIKLFMPPQDWINRMDRNNSSSNVDGGEPSWQESTTETALVFFKVVYANVNLCFLMEP